MRHGTGRKLTFLHEYLFSQVRTECELHKKSPTVNSISPNVLRLLCDKIIDLMVKKKGLQRPPNLLYE